MKKEDSVNMWEDSGLDGVTIWDACIPWGHDPAVINLANKLAGLYMGPSEGHRQFEELNGFRSPLSYPRTQSAERMAALTCHQPDPYGETGEKDREKC
jgi:hypothetical protein